MYDWLVREVLKRADLCVRWYDRIHPRNITGTPVAEDADFYVRQARRTGGPVLELGCGTGRIAIPLAEAGFDVTGLDLSAPMLRIATRKIGLTRTRGRITLVRGDMAKFSLKRKFPLIIIPFRAFQHLLTPVAQRSCLESCRRHLTPKGRLIVDIFDPRLDMCHPAKKPPVRGRRKSTWETRKYMDPAGGRRLILKVASRSNDPVRQILREVWEFTVRDRRGQKLERCRVKLTLRWTYRFEMRHLLELCGLKPLACYGDFMGGPPRYGMEQIWVAARK